MKLENNLRNKEDININWWDTYSINWVITQIKEIDLPKEVQKFFNSYAEQFIHPPEYIKKDFLELYALTLNNWEKIYIAREHKDFLEWWIIDDSIYIYETSPHWKKIWHWKLVKPIGADKWHDAYVWFTSTEENFIRTWWYWSKRLLLMNYLSDLYFNETLHSWSPLTYESKKVFENLAKKWFAEYFEPKNDMPWYYKMLPLTQEKIRTQKDISNILDE